MYYITPFEINTVIIPEAFMAGIESTGFCLGYGAGLVQKIKNVVVSLWCSGKVKLSQLNIHKWNQNTWVPHTVSVYTTYVTTLLDHLVTCLSELSFPVA